MILLKEGTKFLILNANFHYHTKCKLLRMQFKTSDNSNNYFNVAYYALNNKLICVNNKIIVNIGRLNF